MAGWLAAGLLLLLVTGAAAASGPNPVRPAAEALRIQPASAGGAPKVAGRAELRGPQTYQAPVSGGVKVLEPFVRPATPYAAGHRGVDLATAPGQVVLAAAGGVVSFAGRVAGRGVVVIAHADGVRTEYEPVRALVTVGVLVAGGQPIAVTFGPHRGHPPDSCLHWGARRSGVYFDPLSLLAPLGPIRLLPWPPH